MLACLRRIQQKMEACALFSLPCLMQQRQWVYFCTAQGSGLRSGTSAGSQPCLLLPACPPTLGTLSLPIPNWLPFTSSPSFAHPQTKIGQHNSPAWVTHSNSLFQPPLLSRYYRCALCHICNTPGLVQVICVDPSGEMLHFFKMQFAWGCNPEPERDPTHD